MPSAPRFVRVTSFRPSKGSELWFSHDLRAMPCGIGDLGQVAVGVVLILGGLVVGRPANRANEPLAMSRRLLATIDMGPRAIFFIS